MVTDTQPTSFSLDPRDHDAARRDGLHVVCECGVSLRSFAAWELHRAAVVDVAKRSTVTA